MTRVALLGCALLAACSVQRPGPLDQVYPCATSDDCLDGFTCVDRSMLGQPGFCSPSCDPARATSTCPLGLCTPEGACLSRCLPETDGTLRVGCPSGLTCVRTDLFREEGVCWHITGCSMGSDCSEEDVPSSCLSEVLGVPALLSGVEIASNRLYCLPAPTGPLSDRCGPGSIPLAARGAFPGACLPTCNDPDDVCPPGMTCWTELGWLFGAVSQSVCWVGEWGALCGSDADCLLGRCLETGDGRRVCTERCADVPLGGPDGGGCEVLSEVSFSAPGGSEFTCRNVGSERVCIPRGRVGAPCGAGRQCLDELRCLPLRNEDTGVCSDVCDLDEDCYVASIPEPRRTEVYCDTENRICLPQQRGGSACDEDHACLSGRCVAGLCTSPAT